MNAPVGMGNVVGITLETRPPPVCGRAPARFDLLFVPPPLEDGDFGAAAFAIYDPFLKA
ncbi:MAG: hypothetical protein ACYDCA_02395 [Candidatus Tyrphobacter sp.]